MSKLLVVGTSPLPFEDGLRRDASNLRSWHLTKPLVEAGHDVRLVTCGAESAYPNGLRNGHSQQVHGLSLHVIPGTRFHARETLQQHHDEFRPDAVIGINTYPSSRAVTLETDCPIWCDLNGWIMAEGQTKAKVFDDDIYLSHFWKMQRRILDRADYFSTVSEAQAHALVGELACRGRLNKANFAHEFAHPIPNAMVEDDAADEGGEIVVRGKLAADQDFVVLWLGGYNTWTDVDTLLTALEIAMARNPSIRFVSTGGALPGHDEKTFERFRQSVRQSRFSDRFHFQGWVPTEHVASYLRESDLGLNVDSQNYETTYGARNRINEMIRYGLPVLTTIGTEISRDLEREGLAIVVPIGNAEAFADAICQAADDREKTRKMARGALEFANRAYSYQATTRALQRFAKHPCRAPDHGERVVFQDVDFFRADPIIEAPVETDSDAARKLRELEKYVESIHESKFWRLWMSSIRWRRRFGFARESANQGSESA